MDDPLCETLLAHITGIEGALSLSAGRAVKVRLVDVTPDSVYFHLTEPHKTLKITRRSGSGHGWIADMASGGLVGLQVERPAQTEEESDA